MRAILLLFFILFSLSVQATTYYFSFTDGDDGRSITDAQNSATPWKTITKLNQLLDGSIPGAVPTGGDFILLKRGDTWVTTVPITIKRSGTSAGNPITISSYGTGAQPKISAMAIVPFDEDSSNIFISTSALTVNQVNVVMINDVSVEMGRYPNSNASNGGYIAIGTATHSPEKITASAFPLHSDVNYDNAEIQIRASKFVMNRARISDHTNRTLTYSFDHCVRTGSSTACYSAAASGEGFFVQDHIKTLNRENEWYYNRSNKLLNIYSTASSLPTVKASVTDYCILSNNSNDFVTIDGLFLEGADSIGVSITSGSDNITIQNCTIKGAGSDGVRSLGANTKVLYNTITDCQSNGVYIGTIGGTATDARQSGAQVIGNIVRNIGKFNGMIQNGQREGMGIFVSSYNSLIKWNKVNSIGGAGIDFYPRNNVSVIGNVVDTFCLAKNDLGGIYTTNDDNIVLTGREVIDNIVMHSYDSRAGTTMGTADASASHGIYPDNNSEGILMTGNTVYKNKGAGFYFHRAASVIMTGNLSFGNERAFTSKQDHEDRVMLSRNNEINNNIFVSDTTTIAHRYNTFFMETDVSPADGLQSSLSEVQNFGVINYNYFAYLRVGLISSTPTFWLNGTGVSFTNWKSNTGHDLNSTLSTRLYSNQTAFDTSVVLATNQTTSSRAMTELGNWNWTNIKGQTFNRNSVFTAFAGELLFKGTYNPPVEPPPSGDIIIIKTRKRIKLM